MRNALYLLTLTLACQSEPPAPPSAPVTLEPTPTAPASAPVPTAPPAAAKAPTNARPHTPPPPPSAPEKKIERPKSETPGKDDPGKRVEGPTKFLDDKAKVEHENAMDDMMGASKAKTKSKLDAK